ncbi:family 78 glycoside hydrolase catalytic domain [Flavihumibacter profundi]|uniref:family 78 glycoside hydrolase catalytic domain n=1 Tax=Flavihumibacter profundi TaxID=2716883 RepID=UPI001CC4E6CC|nr:family 78 glycoside hydrolase catalytic domain [Flavihumibacter profundi]MBZ5858790.1 family 78 glycoside hydrolase catalytic domain [Flavihumibacter profundi]
MISCFKLMLARAANKIVLSFCLLLLLIVAENVNAQITVQHLLTENRDNPIGLDIAQPRFSWQLSSPARNTLQTAFEITVLSGKTAVWNSGKQNSGQSVQVPYQGQALKSNQQYTWRVRVWDNHGKQSAWSAPAYFQIAFLDAGEWKAKWIMPGYIEDSVMRPSPLMRKEFTAAKKIVSATAYITAHGMYEAHINGKRVGDAYLTPGWTAYKKRLQYQTYDVTSLLKSGANAIAVELGSGWYRGIIGFTNSLNVYGKDIALLFQLNITYNDGTTETIGSDQTWKTSTGQIRYAEIYNGETIDARMDKPGWMKAGYPDTDWYAAREANFPKDVLLATYNEPVRKQEVYKPVKIFTTPAGEKVIDFGQNLVGWVVMKVKGNAGDTIRISHAEVLDKAGNFYTDNLRSAKAQNQYILKGGVLEVFEPHFTWQGFRYAKIEGYPGELNANNFEAVSLYSDMPPTGTFTSSNELINQLQHNIQLGQRGNFLDVPTDCPQRDERLGWTGDAQAFSRTASFNMQVNNFFAKWLKDLEAEQVNGTVPFVVPNVLGNPISSAGWADAATIVPWNMYLAYGDKRMLENQYYSMKSYVESIRRSAKNDLWNTGFHFGDWLFYRPDDDNDGRAAVTDKYMLAQCFYANSTQLLINAARVLGKTEDAANYESLLTRIKEAYQREYVTANGRLVSGTQTAYVLALEFDMLPEQLRKQAAERLVENIKSYDQHITTGFLGSSRICHVLTRFGYTNMAYKLLLQETYPSWLYPVKMGATTIWERWDGIKPDSSFQTPGMNSFNHYAYGAIGDWMYRVMAGLDTEEDGPGYRKIRIRPHVGGKFSHVAASLKTYYGIASSSWTIEGDQLKMDIEIPANTSATIYIPVLPKAEITESGKPLLAKKEIQYIREEAGYAVVTAGSGLYHFSTAIDSHQFASIKNATDYEGTYQVKEGMTREVEVSAENGSLFISAWGHETELFPEGPNSDHFKGDNGAIVMFTRNSSGKVVKVRMEMQGLVFDGER